MPRYKLAFLPSALKEWAKLGGPVKEQFKKKLEERLDNPEVPGDRLRGFDNHYKIKQRSSGYRLVYEVQNAVMIVSVISVGKRERNTVYKTARKRQ